MSSTLTAAMVTLAFVWLASPGLARAQLERLPIDRTSLDAAPQTGADTGRRAAQIPVTLAGGTETLDVEATPPGVVPAVPARSIPLERPIDPDTYLCGPGDVFELDFWGQQNFKLRVTGDLEGRAFIPKVGFVEIAGKSLSEVRKQVQKKVRQQYPGLTFDLTLAQPRTFLVHVVDNVSKPAAYSAQPLERVSSVLERAGAKGSRRRISVRRTSGSEVAADLVMYERTGDTRYNPFVLDGDVIRVPFPELVVTVDGPVQHPGSYELVGTRDLKELFELSGGFTSSVARTLPILVIRRDQALRSQALYLPFSTTGAPPDGALHDDDRVTVRSATELQRTVLLFGPVEGADPMDGATSTKRLPYVEGDTVRTIIERAGGIKAPGDLRKSYISRHAEGSPPVLIPVDLEALLVRREYAADKPIVMGDEIVVPPMRRGILVEGAVARGGIYPYDPNFGVPEFIANAGGLTRTARGIDTTQIIHSTGKTEPYEPGKKPQAGDTILVPERNFARAEVVSLVIAGAGLVLGALTLAVVALQ